MKDMRTARRMQLTLLSAIVIVGLGASVALMYSLHYNASIYDAIFTNEVAQQDAARVIQVTFKKQVQEWKNILLRGSDYEQYQKYSKGFHTEETAVRAAATDLQAKLTDDEAKSVLAEFIAAHDAMKAGYGKAVVVRGRPRHEAGHGRCARQGTGSGADGFDRQARRAVEGSGERGA